MESAVNDFLRLWEKVMNFKIIQTSIMPHSALHSSVFFIANHLPIPDPLSSSPIQLLLLQPSLPLARRPPPLNPPRLQRHAHVAALFQVHADQKEEREEDGDYLEVHERIPRLHHIPDRLYLHRASPALLLHHQGIDAELHVSSRRVCALQLVVEDGVEVMQQSVPKHINIILAQLIRIVQSPVAHNADLAEIDFAVFLEQVGFGGDCDQDVLVQGNLYALKTPPDLLARAQNRKNTAIHQHGLARGFRGCDFELIHQFLKKLRWQSYKRSACIENGLPKIVLLQIGGSRIRRNGIDCDAAVVHAIGDCGPVLIGVGWDEI